MPRRLRTQAQHSPYPFALAPNAALNGGAEEWVFEAPYTLPVQVFSAAGRLTRGSLGVFDPGVLVLSPAQNPQATPPSTGEFALVEPPIDRGSI